MAGPRDEKRDERDADGEKSVTDALRELTTKEEAPTVAELQPQIVAISPDDYKLREIARIKQEAAASELDKTVPGGRYLVDGKLVDCNGEPVKQ